MSSYIQDLGDFKSTLKSIGGGALSVVQSQASAKGEAAAYKAMAEQQAAQKSTGGGMPGWVIPVGIGAVALVAILALRKK